MRIRIADSVKKPFLAGCFQRFAELRTLVELRMIYFSNEALVLFAMPIDENAVPTNTFYFDIIMRIAFDFCPNCFARFPRILHTRSCSFRSEHLSDWIRPSIEQLSFLPT